MNELFQDKGTPRKRAGGDAKSATSAVHRDVPLAERMRPQGFNDLVGQEKIWSKGTPLWTLAVEDRFGSLIFWGPPGTGKTSLAHVIGRGNGETKPRPVVM